MFQENITSHPDDPPVTKKEILGWAMFDFANSSYTTVVITVIYSAFFIKYIVPKGSVLQDSYWSIAIIIPTVLTMLISPFIGVLCDCSGHKKRYLMMTTLLCALSTAALGWVQPGHVILGIILLTFSTAGFMLSESFCASFLTDLATKKNMAFISGIGWGIGYMGGLASLILVMGIITATPEERPELYIQQNQWAMVAIGAFFLIAALPTFSLVRERSKPASGFESWNWTQLFKAGVDHLKSSFSIARNHQILFQFLFAFTIYMAGIDAIIKFVGIYATAELKFSTADLTVMFLILQFSAMGGALGFGALESKIGAKWTVMATLFWWILGVLGIFFLAPLSVLFSADPKTIFFLVSLVAGAGIGATQSSSRAVVGLLAPKEYSAEMFGFWGMFSRAATILGMTFGFAADLLASRRLALLLILAFFIAGSLLLARIPLEEGITKGRKT
ncbi:MFS transporter [Deltaproteobacteria bacterium TL4]